MRIKIGLMLAGAFVNCAWAAAIGNQVFTDGDPIALSKLQFKQKYPSSFNGITETTSSGNYYAIFALSAIKKISAVNSNTVFRFYHGDRACGAGIGFIQISSQEKDALLLYYTEKYGAPESTVTLKNGDITKYFSDASAYADLSFGEHKNLFFVQESISLKTCGAEFAEFFRVKPR